MRPFNFLFPPFLLLILTIYVVFTPAHAQIRHFEDVRNGSFEPWIPDGMNNADVAWADYDNDGDLDFIACGALVNGNPVTRLYINDNGIFLPDTSAVFVGITDGSVDWGDYNNDGNIDLLLTGRAFNGPRTLLYANIGNGQFQRVSTELWQFQNSLAKWVDYDNDGDLDIFLTGEDADSLYQSLFYRNDNGLRFELVNEVVSLRGASADFGDYDLDGDQDLILSGSGFNENKAYLYRNDGGSWKEMTEVNLLGLGKGSVAWGDYDNDGLLDILMTGEISDLQPATILYKNFLADSTHVFEIMPFNFLNVSHGVGIWGDVNDDGYLDIFLSGNTPSNSPQASLFINQGGNDFLVSIDSFHVKFQGADAAFGDFDQDNKLDLILTSTAIDTQSFDAFSLYKNIDQSPNVPPLSPLDLQSDVEGNRVILSWFFSPNTDTSIVLGQTYNIYVGSPNQPFLEVSPHANTSNGYRRLAQLGNVGHSRSIVINDLPPGQYFWSVQAIDQDFEGSLFAAWEDFEISEQDDLVYPGDANHDKVANIWDLLPIGLSYGERGPDRPNASIEWVGQVAPDWNTVLYNGKNTKHADCNGDGEIALDDVAPILLNYGLSHNSNRVANCTGETTLSLGQPNGNDTLFVPIFLGTEDSQAREVYGLAFSLSYDGTEIPEEKFQVSFEPSWLGTPGVDAITAFKHLPSNSRTDIGLVRNDGQIRTGFGKIATIIIVMDDDISRTHVLESLEINEIQGVNSIGEDLSICAEDFTTSIKNDLTGTLHVYPNPARDLLHISAPDNMKAIELFQVDGKRVWEQTGDLQERYTLDINHIEPGIYFLKIKTRTQSITRKVVFAKE